METLTVLAAAAGLLSGAGGDPGVPRVTPHPDTPPPLPRVRLVRAPPSGGTKVQIADLELTEPIGRSRFGVVYLGVDKATKVEFAVKIIPIVAPGKLSQELKGCREARRGFKHDHIVKIHHAFFYHGGVRIVMELMNEGSLAGLVGWFPEKPNGGRVNDAVLAAIATQLLEALEEFRLMEGNKHAHCGGHILSPENILINSRGEIKINNLGSSDELDSVYNKYTPCNHKLSYLPPEHFYTTKRNLANNVWSVGCILFETYAQKPFPHGSRFDVANTWPDGTPKFTHDLPESSAASFVKRFFVVDLERRPSAAELMKDPFLVAQNALRAQRPPRRVIRVPLVNAVLLQDNEPRHVIREWLAAVAAQEAAKAAKAAQEAAQEAAKAAQEAAAVAAQ